ncbi:Zn-dependent peptidase ImmA (M78 family)/DNA-binding XRE family transcriptional regulator [Arcicella rosea]|uniref:helix-turn-helix domain-containing protein n=1 Tax=Arcicella rosea TaxID=502909 RepID=UPI00345DD0C2
MKIRPETIVLARESRSYTQKELANLLGVEQGTISKIEKGLLEPSDSVIQNISDKLDYPLSFFSEPLIRVQGLYRMKLSMPVSKFKACEAKMTIIERHFTKLHDAVELPDINIPSWDIDKNGSPEMAAIFVRERWRIPKGRIDNLTKILEDNGIVIIMLDLGDLDALSTFSETRQPLIFLNKRRTSDRLRYNLAHELGHFVLHWGQIVLEDRDKEQEANEFASEFLMPMRDIESQLTRLTQDKIIELKRYWKTSMKAIVRKAYTLGTLTKDQYYYLNKQFNYMGYAKGEPELFPAEKETLFSEIISIYINELNYSKEQLSELLNTNVSELESLYFGKTSIKAMNSLRIQA